MLNIRAKESDSICITATAYKQGEERGTKLFEKADIKNMGNINKLIALDHFVKVRIDVFDTNFSDSKIAKTEFFVDETPEFSGLSGLGNVSDLESRLEEKFEARLREMERKQLLEENQKLKNQVDELEADLDDAEEVIGQMSEQVKSSKSMKSYAELAGIALDRLGLKSQVKGVLSGFLGDEQSDDDTPTHIEDNSGIIDDLPNPNQQQELQPKQRIELVELINYGLQSLTDKTLRYMFSIVSEIEKNQDLAFPVLSMIEQHNQSIQQTPTNDENNE